MSDLPSENPVDPAPLDRPGGTPAGFATDLLVVGAGTTGLTLALQAHDHGARVRVVERRAEPFQPSRAMVMHPRTLELLRPLGVTHALLARGDSSPSVRLHLRSRVVDVSSAQLSLPGTAFPQLLLIRQADVEAVLAAALAERGVTVERGVEVARVARLPRGGARAVLRAPAATGPIDAGEQREEVLRCRYLAGCDGAASLVRRSVGGWLGGDYRQEVVLADVELATPEAPAAPVALEAGRAHLTIGRPGLVFLLNRGEQASWRLFATRRAGDDRLPFGQPGPEVPRAELTALLEESGLPARIDRVSWSAQLRLQHRIASRFSRGALFIAGDAAHLHSPAGAQGMNAGIHDAINLGWKLAFGARAAGTAAEAAARPGSALLDSYAQERRPADRAVLRLTHALYWVEGSLHPLAQLGRAVLVPLTAPLLPWASRQPRLTTAVMRTLAQFRLHYRRSPLSMRLPASPEPVRGGLARRGLRPGSRVADTLVRCAGRRVRLHELLATPGVHILLQADARPVPERMLGPRVHAYRLDDRPGTGMLVVRPDGYVALRGPVLDEEHLAAWLHLVGLPTDRPRPRSA